MSDFGQHLRDGFFRWDSTTETWEPVQVLTDDECECAECREEPADAPPCRAGRHAVRDPAKPDLLDFATGRKGWICQVCSAQLWERKPPRDRDEI